MAVGPFVGVAYSPQCLYFVQRGAFVALESKPPPAVKQLDKATMPKRQVTRKDQASQPASQYPKDNTSNIYIYIYIYICFLLFKGIPLDIVFFLLFKGIPLDFGLFSTFKGYTLRFGCFFHF